MIRGMNFDMNKERRTIKAVERTLDIIEVLHEREEATVSEIADAVDLSDSSIHHHLTTLSNNGYVTNKEGTYRLTERFLILGGPVRSRLDVFRTGREDIDQLAESTGETARFVIERAGYGITIYQTAGKMVEEYYSGLGQQEPLHSTAAGKAILACMSQEARNECLDRRELSKQTRNTITDRDQLEEELDQVSSRGIAIDNEEHIEGRRCVAVPILQDEEEVLGAISLSAPTSRKDQSWFESDGADALRHTAGVIKTFSKYSVWTE